MYLLGRAFDFTDEKTCYEFPLYGCEDGGCDYSKGISTCQALSGYIASDNQYNIEMVLFISILFNFLPKNCRSKVTLSNSLRYPGLVD